MLTRTNEALLYDIRKVAADLQGVRSFPSDISVDPAKVAEAGDNLKSLVRDLCTNLGIEL